MTLRNEVIRATPVLLCFVALSAATPAVAQSDTDRRVWTAVSVQGQLGTEWRWQSDSLVRARDGAGALDIVGERVTVTRSITPRASAGVRLRLGRRLFPRPLPAGAPVRGAVHVERQRPGASLAPKPGGGVLSHRRRRHAAAGQTARASRLAPHGEGKAAGSGLGGTVPPVQRHDAASS